MNEVSIQQEHDGFRVVVFGDDGTAQLTVSISQEDTVEALTEVFDYFHIKNSYEDVY